MPLSIPTQLATINNNTSGVTSWATSSVTFPAGSLGVMLLAVAGSSANANISVSGATSGAWTVVAAEDQNTGTVHTAIAYKYFASSVTEVVTASFASSVERMGWLGYVTGSNLAPFDQPGIAATPISTSSPGVTSAGNLAADNEIVFVVVMVNGNNSGPVTWPQSGYTSLANPGDTTRHFAAGMQYQILSGGSGAPISSGSDTVAASAYWSWSLATFKPAASSGYPKLIGMWVG